MKKAEFLGKGPLVKTMWSLTYPDLVAQMVGAVYNLADSIFVGQFSGSSVEEGKRALAGLSISAPIEQCLLVGLSLIFAPPTGFCTPQKPLPQLLCNPPRTAAKSDASRLRI
mgnify:CR=1 FL=1